MSGCLAGLLLGCLADWLPGCLAGSGCLAGCLAGWVWLAACLAGCLRSFAKVPPQLFGPKVIQKLHFVNYNYVLNERLPKPEFLKSTTSICLACWLAALCTRVREIQRIRKSSGCTLYTCYINTTNSEIQRLYFAHVFKEYDEFGVRTAALCARVQRIR